MADHTKSAPGICVPSLSTTRFMTLPWHMEKKKAMLAFAYGKPHARDLPGDGSVPLLYSYRRMRPHLVP